MRTLTLNIPDNVEVENREFAMIVATRLYEMGRLSLGQAADLAGLTKRAFIELLGNYDVSVFNFPASDLANDIVNA